MKEDDANWARMIRHIWEEDRATCRSLMIQRGETMPRLKEDGLYARLAGIAQVPATAIEELWTGVSYELSIPWGWDKPVRRSEKSAVRRSKKPALVQLRRALRTLRELPEIVLNVEPQELREELFSEPLSSVQTKPPPRPRGRPRGGAFSKCITGSLVEFAFCLLLDVRAAGGRLTLDKNRGTGTLVDALDLLRPYLPQGFIPQRLPFGTLDRVRALDRKISTDPPRLSEPNISSITIPKSLFSRIRSTGRSEHWTEK
jgi:hypothetical protein